VSALNYSPADAAADLRKSGALKRAVVRRSVLLVVLLAACIAPKSILASFSVVLGGLCGLLNMLITMHGTQQLVQRRNVGAFVISSFLRLAAFAIVPLGLSLGGKWWTLVIYFACFFLPLALYLLLVRRHFERE